VCPGDGALPLLGVCTCELLAARGDGEKLRAWRRTSDEIGLVMPRRLPGGEGVHGAPGVEVALLALRTAGTKCAPSDDCRAVSSPDCAWSGRALHGFASPPIDGAGADTGEGAGAITVCTGMAAAKVGAVVVGGAMVVGGCMVVVGGGGTVGCATGVAEAAVAARTMLG